jgi:NADH-quinone oxidoreductase subunit M
VVAVLAATGIILSPIYLLKMYHMTALGEISNNENKNLIDLSFREALPLLVLAIMTIVLGLYPKLIFSLYGGV